MNIEQAKAIPVAKILEKLNRNPVRQVGKQTWFISPWRDEKTASFHVHEGNNWWFDFGIGMGGNSIALVIHHLKQSKEAHTISDALRWLKNMVGEHSITKPPFISKGEERRAQHWRLLDSGPIKHLALQHFLERRGIPLSVASELLTQVRARNREGTKTIFALGLPNEENGYELRNPILKSSIGPKALSFVRGKITSSGQIHLFEGMMDYLTVITCRNGKKLEGDAIILNSVACLKQAIGYIKNFGYRTAHSWLDNDEAGKKAKDILDQFVKTEAGLVHMPMNQNYSPFKDVNAAHMSRLEL